MSNKSRRTSHLVNSIDNLEADFQDSILDGSNPFTGDVTVPNLITSGNVDGRDVSVDGTKLDTIEEGATADQTDEEIKAAYEANDDTNAFTDAEKTKLADTYVFTLGHQGKLNAIDGDWIKGRYEGEPDTNAFTDAEKAKLGNIQAGATDDMTDAEIKTAYEGNDNTNAFTDAEQTKLAGIEAHATGDMTVAEIKTAYEANNDTNAFTDAEKAKLSNVTIHTIGDSGLTEKNFTGYLKSKLDGIEANADVTDTANVVAALAAGNGITIASDGTITATGWSAGTGGGTASGSLVAGTNVLFISNADGTTTIHVEDDSNYYTVQDGQLSENNFTTQLKDKLEGIESGATGDQTGSQIKTLYENEANTNAFTDGHQGKLNAINGNWVKERYELEPNTNAFTDADHSKLNGIEAGATADQTPAQIKAAYEGNANTNAFTDADHSKLNGIEAGARGDQTAAEIKAAYESNNNTNVFTDADHAKLDSIEAGAQGNQTAQEIKTAYESNGNTNAFTDADHSKLNGIEAGARGDQTAAEIKAAYESNSDTNAFTNADHAKLDSIETGARGDQTAEEIKDLYESNSNRNAYTDIERNKLINIESLATQDQTPAEIKAAYESNANTNAFTNADHTKLDGINALWIKQQYEGNGNTNAFTNAEQSKLAGLQAETFTELVQDTSPQLGGNLDAQSRDISSVRNITVNGRLTQGGELLFTQHGSLTMPVGADATFNDWVYTNGSFKHTGPDFFVYSTTGSEFRGPVTFNQGATTHGVRIMGDATYTPRLDVTHGGSGASATFGINQSTGGGRRFEILAPDKSGTGSSKIIEHTETSELAFYTNNTMRCRYTADGSFQWGFTNSNDYSSFVSGADKGFALTPQGKIHCGIAETHGHFWVYNGNQASSKLHKFMFYRTGQTTSSGHGEVGNITVEAGSTAFNTSSDARLKTERGPVDNALELINKLTPRKYSFTEDGPTHIGLYAQEVLAAGGFDSSITADDEGYYSMDYSKLVGGLIGAVKELTEQNKNLEKRILALEEKAND